jgi:hypothetical protein
VPGPVEDDIGDQPITTSQVVPRSLGFLDMVVSTAVMSLDKMGPFRQIDEVRCSAIRKPANDPGRVSRNHDIGWYIPRNN